MGIKASKMGGEYDCLKDWPAGIYLQCGGSGVVLSKKSYITAFFEAFPNDPSTFIRGEGETIELAEESAWNKYQKIMNCTEHKFNRHGKTTKAICLNCNLRLTNYFPPLECCSICNKENSNKNFNNIIFCIEHYFKEVEKLQLDNKFKSVDNLFINYKNDNYDYDCYYYNDYLISHYYYSNILKNNTDKKEFEIVLFLEEQFYSFDSFTKNAIFDVLNQNSIETGYSFTFNIYAHRLLRESFLYNKELLNKLIEYFWENKKIDFEKEILDYLLYFIEQIKLNMDSENIIIGSKEFKGE